MLAGFASGELVELSVMERQYRRRPATIDQWTMLAHLRAARRAGLELAEFSVASWKASGPRLGLLLRPQHPNAVRVTIGAGWSLRVFIGSRFGLVPVFAHHLGPWRKTPTEVTRQAILNTTTDDLRSTALPSSGPSAEVWLVVGGSFTANHLLDIESLIGPMGSSTVVAGLYGDRALLVARSTRPAAPAASLAAELATAIDRLELAASSSNGDAWFGLDRARGVVVQCRSDRRLAVLETRVERR